MDCSPPSSSEHGISQASISQNTGAGCHFFLQATFPTQRLNLRLLHWHVDSLPLSHLGSSFLATKNMNPLGTRLQSTGSRGLSDFTFTFHFPALEKEMATRSSVLAWRIPGMGEPSRLPCMGLHRVGHDWSDLAAAAADIEIQVKEQIHLSLREGYSTYTTWNYRLNP